MLGEAAKQISGVPHNSLSRSGFRQRDKMNTRFRFVPQICAAFLVVAVACLSIPVHAQTTQSPAQAAQLSAESLLASAVEQIGPQHRDVALAIEEFRKGAFLEARNLLKEAIKKDPTLPPDGVMMARMLFTANQLALARQELERTVAEAPTDPEPYLIFGELAFQQRHFADAELSFRKAYDLIQKYTANPYRKGTMRTRALSGLAGVAENREDWGNAAKFLTEIVKADKSNAGQTTRLARALFEQDQKIGDGKEQESQAYKLLIGLWEQDKVNVRRPEITMGSMYQSKGEKKITAQLMKTASEQDTKGLQTQLTVARWALGTGDMALAQACTDRAQQIAPNSVEAKLIAGLTARYKRDFQTARKTLEAAHLQSPSNLAALLQLAVVLVEGDEQAKRTAFEYSQVASRIYPDLAEPTGREAAVTSAWILYNQGRVREAQMVLQKALAGGAVSAESSYYAAKILHQTNADVAKQLLGTALKGDGVFPARTDAESLLQSLGG